MRSESFPRFKVKAWRSEDYLSYVRSRPCVVTGQSLDVVAHHVRCLGHGGVGLKPPDYLCLPLITAEHTKLHAMGEESYWKSKGEDPVSLLVMTMTIYLIRNPNRGLVDALGSVISG